MAVRVPVLWGMLALYAIARVLQLYSGIVATLVIVIFHVLPPAVFALVHASRPYGAKGGAAFGVLCAGTGAAFELMALRSGFPFGHYYFTNVMGPKIFGAPVFLVLAYVGMGYAAWVLALLIAGKANDRLCGRHVFLVPVIAAFVMTAWDLSMDPEWSTVDRAWVWKDGGAYFGVPLSNYLGWLLTTYIFYQLFALYVHRHDPHLAQSSYWRLGVLLYLFSAAGNLLLAIPTGTAVYIPPVVRDGAGHAWMVADVVRSCMLISIFVMGPIGLLAWARSGPAGVLSRDSALE